MSQKNPYQAPPSYEFSKLSDHDLDEKIRRLSKQILVSKLPDGGDKLTSLRRSLAEEQHRRTLARSHKGGGECQRRAETKILDPPGSEGFDPSISSIMCHPQEQLEEKTDASFSEELRLKICDKYKRVWNNGSQMPEDKKTQSPLKLARISYTELPSASCSKKDKRGISNNRRKKIVSSSISSSHAGRKLPRRLSERIKVHPNRGSMCSKFEKVQHVVLLDDEDVQPMHSIEGDDATDEWKYKLYYPSSDDPECVELYYSDIECLDPGAYLSSRVMNFYVQYLQRSLSPTDKRREEYYIFNTFFYSKLEEAVTYKGDRSTAFSKLRRWWKGMDIFQKAYILLPIYRDKHWSLVIICMPGKEDESGPIVLHLDSLGLHASSHIFSVVSSYLKEEWNYVNENALPSELPLSERIWTHLPRRIEKEKIMVPQQQNDYDCGIFVLYFMERFIGEAPKRLRKTDLTMFGRNWFKPEEASGLRQKIRDLLVKEFESRFGGEVAQLASSSRAPQSDE
ncbi:ubiquitin-like-specific protease 1D [Iris pallida]|uniref:Ubiquitin-like-specific protease 1D n=1 Tax=Iris pallida TaxID=29817 RepID=A0AAX6EHC0_IRIPA|nr:ubiquitin-like-specific protease 1D [Iris pallida]